MLTKPLKTQPSYPNYENQNRLLPNNQAPLQRLPALPQRPKTSPLRRRLLLPKLLVLLPKRRPKKLPPNLGKRTTNQFNKRPNPRSPRKQRKRSRNHRRRPTSLPRQNHKVRKSPKTKIRKILPHPHLPPFPTRRQKINPKTKNLCRRNPIPRLLPNR